MPASLIILPRSSKELMTVLASTMKMHMRLVSKKQRMVYTDGQDVASHGSIANEVLMIAECKTYSAKLPDLLAMLNIPATSKLAAMMAATLAQCEAKSPEAHVLQPATASPTCVTSLEEMINYVADGFPQDARIYPLNRTILPGTYNMNTQPYSLFFISKISTIARNCNKHRNKLISMFKGGSQQV